MWFDSESGSVGLSCGWDCRLLWVAENLYVPMTSQWVFTIHSNYEQEISSVYQFIDVLYNLRSWVALLW